MHTYGPGNPVPVRNRAKARQPRTTFTPDEVRRRDQLVNDLARENQAMRARLTALDAAAQQLDEAVRHPDPATSHERHMGHVWDGIYAVLAARNTPAS